MAPLFTIAVLAASLWPQADFWSQAQSELGRLATKFDSMPDIALAKDFGQPPAIYFDAPPRAYGGMMRR